MTPAERFARAVRALVGQATVADFLAMDPEERRLLIDAIEAQLRAVREDA